tara:strand:+ start:302 stop:1120 length:819 start_codon:yes stop_codon:yes gene_type:complete
MNYKKIFDIKNQIAVITGAGGMLGTEIAIALAQYGAKLALVDIEERKINKLAKLLKTKYKTKCLPIKCDVSNDRDVAIMTKNIEKELGPIQILINNAATKGKSLKEYFKPVEKYNYETWKNIISVNLDGMYLVAKEIGSRMAKRKKGSIIQIASIYSSQMASDQRIYKGSKYLDTKINTPAVYSVSKSGVVGLTLHLASYWASQKIRVNTLSPGGIYSGQNKTFVNSYSKRIPLGRMAKKEEMIGAILYLSSDASSYVTGQNIFVDGGLSSW